MSKNVQTTISNEIDDDDIEPSELIDTQENKPKMIQEEDIIETEESQPKRRKLESKQVGKLTEDEKEYLINLYRKGEEDDLYKVYFYKNGTHRIVKKKQPQKFNTAKRMLESRKPTMTNEQILMEHVIDLETKFATLYQKHKKLKKSYKSLQDDIYYEDNVDTNTKEFIKGDTDKETVVAAAQEPEPMPETIPNNNQYPRYNEFQNNYINKIKRPQKGYRKMMAGMM